jgi:hypothetical protein
MKTQTNNWYEVVRNNGVIQYAQKINEVYYLHGGGFGIIEFDAQSVTPIDGYPPSKNVHTYVCFDGDSKNIFKAIIDKYNRWNGWEMPFIHADDVVRMMDHLSEGGDWIAYCFVGDDIVITHLNDEDDGFSTVHRTTIDGEHYYYFGNEGWVFEEARLQYNDNEQE